MQDRARNCPTLATVGRLPTFIHSHSHCSPARTHYITHIHTHTHTHIFPLPPSSQNTFNVAFFLCVLAFSFSLAWRLYAKNRDTGAGKSFCQIKLMPSVIGCVCHVVLLNLMFVIGDVAVFQGMNGGDPKIPFDLAIGLLAPLSVTAILTLLVVALSWVSLASNAKTFRKTSPASAQRKAKVFVGVVAGCVL